jgi:hypothetical protein
MGFVPKPVRHPYEFPRFSATFATNVALDSG